VSAVGSIQAIPPDSAHFTQVVKEFASPDGLFSPAFTCFGTSVDFAAPGVGVISTVPKNGFKAMDGTSMAAPHVTGLAALLLAHDPMLINSRRDRSRVDLLVQRLRGTAKPLAFGAARAGAGLPVYAPAAAYLTPGGVSSLGSAALGLGHVDAGMHPCRCKH
jgi:subtilisin family serine protease